MHAILSRIFDRRQAESADRKNKKIKKLKKNLKSKGGFVLNSVADVWENVLAQMSGALSQMTIDAWFDEVEPVDIKGNRLILRCDNDFKRGYINSLFLEHIKDAMRNLFSLDFEVAVLDTPALKKLRENDSENPSDAKLTDRRENYTFENFIVGPSNKLAYAACQNVANMPAVNYNPLLIYGDSGLGKTHLICAIANSIRRTFPNFKVTYAKGEDMSNELIDSIQQGRESTAEMREKYRKANILLIDDIQFIAGKKQIQEEFFHTFNTLYEAGCQIVLTSDRPPHEITTLEERLRTRFEWGLMADVEPPDYETRVAIIKSKARDLGIPMPDTVSTYIAENVTANVRQLEGTVNKVMAYQDLLTRDPDRATVKRAMRDIFQNTPEYIPTPEIILRCVSEYYEIDPETIRGQGRGRPAANARQVAIYLIRAMTHLSQDEIGAFLGGRDHSTIIYSIRQTKTKIKNDPSFAEAVKEIKSNINNTQIN